MGIRLGEMQSVSIKNRIYFLDGLRGWASLMVLLSHIMACFLSLSTPVLVFERYRLIEDIHSLKIFDAIFWVVMRFVSDGHLAVLIFFVLSGYVLSLGCLKLDRDVLMRSVVARYFRLVIPIFVTTLIAYLFLKLGLMYNLEVATTPERSKNWLGIFYTFDPSFLKAVKFSIYDVFFNYDPIKTYNSSLWTMSIELIGSMMIYAYFGIFRIGRTVNWRLVLCFTFLLFIFSPLFACFFIGYCLAELNLNHKEKVDSFFQEKKVNKKIFVVILFFLGIVLSTYYRRDHVSCLFASALVFSVSQSESLEKFFSNKLSRFLGEISFPLYLIQIVIICSFSSFLYLYLPSRFEISQVAANFINLFVTVFLCVFVAWLLLPVERMSIDLSKKISKKIIK